MQIVGAMQLVGAMQIVNTIKVRPMKAVVIIQVIIMKCSFGMSRQKKNFSTGGNMMTAVCGYGTEDYKDWLRKYPECSYKLYTQ